MNHLNHAVSQFPIWKNLLDCRLCLTRFDPFMGKVQSQCLTTWCTIFCCFYACKAAGESLPSLFLLRASSISFPLCHSQFGKEDCSNLLMQAAIQESVYLWFKCSYLMQVHWREQHTFTAEVYVKAHLPQKAGSYKKLWGLELQEHISFRVTEDKSDILLGFLLLNSLDTLKTLSFIFLTPHRIYGRKVCSY